MLETFLTYIQKEKLFNPGQKILLAVSGGVDSMVMLHLFRKAGYNIAVAHCNFRLRGDESDGDEKFVTDYCHEHNLRLYVTHFETEEYARQEGISIEMAARSLRYSWFTELLDAEKFDYLATAHHQDDVIETFFINLARGTGIRGLSGIKPKTGRLIRPILFADRLSIRNYAAVNQIKSREDSSNSDTTIRRNFIRHRILPLLDEFHPAFRKNIAKTIDNLNGAEMLFQQKIDEIKTEAVEKYDWGEMIRIAAIKNCVAGKTVLYELLRDKGFSPDQADDIFQTLTGESGKVFYAGTYRLVKDRETLMITKVDRDSPELFYIDKNCPEISSPLSANFEQIKKTSSFRISTDPLKADFDMDKLDFPLLLRKWQEGEYFQPLGMHGFKKISDFFVDEKYSIPEKENAWILSSGNKIVWVVGKRIDERFKITGNTQNIFRVTVRDTTNSLKK